MPGSIRLGTQGWNYDAWVGPFYPENTKVVDFLQVYSRAFDTVEVDSTFYAVPPSRTIRSWAQRTPPGFLFALKMPQEITHERRFRDVQDLAKEFFDRARELEDTSRIQIDRSRELELWAGVISHLAPRGRTVYGYFNNHFAGHSPASARELQRLLNLSPVAPEQLGEQMTLF